MRCQCCDKLLTDYEATLKSAVTGEYLDICIDCIDLGDREDFALIERHDLKDTVPIDLELGSIEDE